MKKYVFTVDTGTTNTRVILWDENRGALGTETRGAGVRNTAIDGNNGRLKAAVKSCLDTLLETHGLDYSQVKGIIASGMITSNVGLVEIPHLAAPVSIDDLAAGMRDVLLEDICPVPISFIPGVKNAEGDRVNLGNFEAMDMMRGEEVESAAMLSRLKEGVPYLLVLPGSHTKFVSVDETGKITGCLTSITGELLNSITNDTIIADAVGRQFVSMETYDPEMLLTGCRTAKQCGIGRACFSARILHQFVTKDSGKLANYILGACLQSDAAAIQSSSALKAGPDTTVIVGGKDPLRRAIADILKHEGRFKQVSLFQSDGDLPLSPIGAYLIADRRKGGK